MKIFEFGSTTFYSGFPIGVHGFFSGKKAFKILLKRATDVYRQKIADDPRLESYRLHVYLVERETDADGIFKYVSNRYFDYRFVNGKVVLISDLSTTTK